MYLISQLIVGDQISLENGTIYFLVYKNQDDYLFLDMTTKEYIKSLPTSPTFVKVVKHEYQERDFKDKNGKVLRPGSTFIDPDNGEEEENWKLSVTVFSKENEEELSYIQLEFTSDCEITTEQTNDYKKLLNLESEANKIIEKNGGTKVSFLDSLFSKKK